MKTKLETYGFKDTADCIEKNAHNNDFHFYEKIQPLFVFNFC